MISLTIDEVYDKIGHLGFAQIVYFLCLGFLQIFTCQHMLLNIYAGLEPSFICITKDGKFNSSNLINKCVENSPLKCDISYNNSFISTANEWDLVCNQKYKAAMVQSVWMGGVMVGAMFLSGLADRIGRLKSLMLALIGLITFDGFAAFSPNFNFLIGLRFFAGMCCSLAILASFVLSQELVGTSYRSVCAVVLAMFFSIGIAVLSATAAYLSNWRVLTLIASVTGLLFLAIPFYVPESPRWLIGNGREKDAKAVLEGMAKLNGTFQLLPAYWDITLPGKSKVALNKSHGVWDLASHPYLLMLTLIQIYSWFVNSAVYYALTMAATSLQGNVYISTTLNGLVEIPACLTGIFIIDRYGRRVAICSFMVGGGLACLLVPLMAGVAPSFVNWLTLIGKLSISASFSVIYLHSGEIFPTVIRNAALGIVSVAARIGGIFSPFILMLGDLHPNLHFLVLGLMTLLGGVLNMKLPETLGMPMPETITDVLALRHLIKAKRKGYNKLSQDVVEEAETLIEPSLIRENTLPSIHPHPSKRIK